MPDASLGPLTDFAENTPTKASGGGRDFVVVRRGEGAFVLDHACQHLGAPLSEGLVHEDTIVCPWHRAVFALTDGTLLEPPGCDRQRAYESRVEDGVLSVSWAGDEDAHPAPPVPLATPEDRRFVVIGAGAAGLSAAERLRQLGFGGEVVLIDREEAAPYDRTKLSKSLTEDAGDVRLRTDDWLSRYGVELRRAEVTGIDPASRTVTFADGEKLSADGLIVAPGAEPRRLDVPGADLGRVLTLRSASDAVAFSEAAKGAKRSAVIGAGFIGMEAATVLSGQGVRTTVIAQDDVPFAKLLGERMGRRLRREQEEAGVAFVGGAEAAELEGEESVRAVLLGDGRRIEADLVVMAVGVAPRADILSGVEPGEDGGIAVAEDLSLPGHDGVVLAGDLARVPTAWGAVRIEHWRWAQQLGRMAAGTLMGAAAPRPVPFFWSKQQADGSYAYVGHAEGWDDILYEGEPDGGSDFAAHYVKGGKVMAVFGHGSADRLSLIERRMAAAGPLDPRSLGIG